MIASAVTARTTALGTPCAESWDEDWVEVVGQREADAGRRICGAQTIGGTPCMLPSDHRSGRCRHHGGFPLTGAPPDNRNGMVHGLYSRRLAICGTHCPVWDSCPMGGGAATVQFDRLGTRVARAADSGDADSSAEDDSRVRIPSDAGDASVRAGDGTTEIRVCGEERGSHRRAANATETLTYAQYLMRLPASERPICPYEEAEYKAVVEDVDRRTGNAGDDPVGTHLAHSIGLVTVMMSRAARGLATKPLTEKFEHTGDTFHMSTEKPSAAFTAFQILSRELRQWLRDLRREYPQPRTREGARPTEPAAAERATTRDVTKDKERRDESTGRSEAVDAADLERNPASMASAPSTQEAAQEANARYAPADPPEIDELRARFIGIVQAFHGKQAGSASDPGPGP